MTSDELAGSAQKAKGAIKQAAGDLTGDAKWQAEGMADRAAGAAREAAGSVKDAADDQDESPQAEARRLREELTEISAGQAEADARAEVKAHEIDSAIDRRTEAVTSVIRDYPLLAAGAAALAGFMLGRLMTGDTYIYRR